MCPTNRVRETYIFLAILAFVVALVGCGKSKQKMQISGLSSLSPEKREIVNLGITQFNELVGEEVVSESPGGYPLSLEVHSLGIMNSIEPAIQGLEIRNGYATANPKGCVIKLLGDILNKRNIGTAVTVVMHEIAHCAGLNHTDTTDDLMSARTLPYSALTPDAIKRFTRDVRVLLGRSVDAVLCQ